jgi:hypothetical protein
MEVSMEAPQKLKIELQYDPGILLLGIYPKECKSIYNRYQHNSQTMELAQVPTKQ